MFYRGMPESELRTRGLEYIPAVSDEDYAYYTYQLDENYWLELAVENGIVIEIEKVVDW